MVSRPVETWRAAPPHQTRSRTGLAPLLNARTWILQGTKLANGACRDKNVNEASVVPAEWHRWSTRGAPRRWAADRHRQRLPAWGLQHVEFVSGTGCLRRGECCAVSGLRRRRARGWPAHRRHDVRQAPLTGRRAQPSAPLRRRSNSRRRRLLGRPCPRTRIVAGPASGTTGGLWST